MLHIAKKVIAQRGDAGGVVVARAPDMGQTRVQFPLDVESLTY